MGSFANSLFQFLMGWTRALLSSLWDASPGGPLHWLSEHWLALLIGICILGALADLAVYLFRWQPYRVWASFFRRLRRRREEKADPAGKDVLPEDAYEAEDASEVYYPAEASQPSRAAEAVREEGPRPGGWTWDPPEERGESPAMAAEEAEYRARASEREPHEALGDDQDMTARFEQAIRPRRRRARMKELFSEEPSETKYSAPQELIDRREAYHRPVYPRGWKGNNQSES